MTKFIQAVSIKMGGKPNKKAESKVQGKKRSWEGTFSIFQASQKNDKYLLDELSRVGRQLKLQVKKTGRYQLTFSEEETVFMVEIMSPMGHNQLNAMIFEFSRGKHSRFESVQQQILN